jgi:hypothetical protein
MKEETMFEDRRAGIRRARLSRQVRLLGALVVLVSIGAVGLAYSQLEIDRFSLHGGGRSSSGALTMEGTAGQATTGSSSGGALSLRGGFWTPGEGSSSSIPPLEDVPEEFASFGFAPNPVRAGSILTLDLPRPVPVRVEAFSVDGSRVAVLLDRPVSAGRLRVSWDGTGEEGRRLAAGVYLLSVRAGSDRATERVVVLD